MKSMVAILLLASLALSADLPQQIHTALGQTPGQVTFTWSTRSPAANDDGVLIQSGSVWFLYPSATRQFQDGQNIWVVHSATVSLSPGRKYTYKVGSATTGSSSAISLVVPADSQSCNFLIFGDLATDAYGTGTWNDIVGSVNELNFQCVVMAGDMAYDLNTNSSTNGDDFMNSLQPVVSSIPFMVAAGNHETSDNYYNYLTRFDMPNNKLYYTFTAGLVRFLAIHTEAFLTETDMLPQMLPYIQSVLNRSQQDRLNYPWMVVFGHRPMYCVAKSSKSTCTTDSSTIRGYLEGWFKQYGVDLYVNGHVHNYQRTAPVYQGQVTSMYDAYTSTYVNPTSTIYVTTGGPGNDGSNTKVDWTNAPDWLIAGDDSYTFSLMNAYNSTHLNWMQLRSQSNLLSDSFWIIKTN